MAKLSALKANIKREGNNISTTIPAYHLELVRDRTVSYDKISKTENIAQVLHKLLDSSPVEQFIVLYVDLSGKVVGAEKVATGGLDRVHVPMRDMFRGAICACVSSVIMGHNHPQGECIPSHEDLSLTTVAINVGHVLGIDVLDHVIVSPDGSHYSVWDHQAECIDRFSMRVAQEKAERIMLDEKNPLSLLMKMLGR